MSIDFNNAMQAAEILDLTDLFLSSYQEVHFKKVSTEVWAKAHTLVAIKARSMLVANNTLANSKTSQIIYLNCIEA